MQSNLAVKIEIDPVEAKEERRVFRMNRHAEFADKRIAFPEAKTFDDFFSMYAIDRKGNPSLAYCFESPKHQSWYVCPQPEVSKFVGTEMLSGYSIYYEIIRFEEDGLALVIAKYNEILGSRWLGYIYADTIPTPPEKDEPIVKVQPAAAPPAEENVVSTDAMTIISEATVIGNLVKLNCGQLERSQYEKVANILKKMGGNWNRAKEGFTFKTDPADLLDHLFLTGKIQKVEKFGYFPTPRALAESVVALAKLKPGTKVLEPSAGQGGLAEIIAMDVSKENIVCLELQEENARVLLEKGFNVIQTDFMTVDPMPAYDACIMNPPFERLQDIQHVMHAWEFLKPGGVLVAIMALSFTFRSDKKCVDFREFVEEHGTYSRNPEGSFKSSGTAVNTVTVFLEKP